IIGYIVSSWQLRSPEKIDQEPHTRLQLSFIALKETSSSKDHYWYPYELTARLLVALDVIRLLHMVFAGMADWSENGKLRAILKERTSFHRLQRHTKNRNSRTSSRFTEEFTSSRDATMMNVRTRPSLSKDCPGLFNTALNYFEPYWHAYLH